MSDTQRALVPRIVPEGGAELARFVEAVETHLMPGKKGVDWQQEDLQLFLVKCRVYGLDPFKSHIYPLPFKQGNRTTIAFHVSIDGWRVVAARDPRYIGVVSVEWCGEDGEWRDTWFHHEAPFAARVTIARTDTTTLIRAVAHYITYVKKTRDGTPTKFWAEMPDVMLATRAEALGLRRAFPEATEGLSDMGLLGPMEAAEGVEHHIDGEARLIDGETGEISDSQASEPPTAPARPAPRATNGRSTEVVTSWWELVDTVWSDLTKRQDRVDAANAWAQERFGADFKDLDSAGTELALKALREWHESEGSQAEATDPDVEQSTLTI